MIRRDDRVRRCVIAVTRIGMLISRARRGVRFSERRFGSQYGVDKPSITIRSGGDEQIDVFARTT